jgi:hypothetical protein
MEISGEPVETLENWMLDESTWSAGVSETPQKVESWMNDDITWVSGDFYAEEAQVVESWMLSTESWNEQFTARIK